MKGSPTTSNIILIAVIEAPKKTKTTTIDLPETEPTQDSKNHLIKQEIHFQNNQNYQHRKKQGSEGNIQGTVYEVETKRNSNFMMTSTAASSQKILSCVFYFVLGGFFLL